MAEHFLGKDYAVTMSSGAAEEMVRGLWVATGAGDKGLSGFLDKQLRSGGFAFDIDPPSEGLAPAMLPELVTACEDFARSIIDDKVDPRVRIKFDDELRIHWLAWILDLRELAGGAPWEPPLSKLDRAKVAVRRAENRASHFKIFKSLHEQKVFAYEGVLEAAAKHPKEFRAARSRAHYALYELFSAKGDEASAARHLKWYVESEPDEKASALARDVLRLHGEQRFVTPAAAYYVFAFLQLVVCGIGGVFFLRAPFMMLFAIILLGVGVPAALGLFARKTWAIVVTVLLDAAALLFALYLAGK